MSSTSVPPPSVILSLEQAWAFFDEDKSTVTVRIPGVWDSNLLYCNWSLVAYLVLAIRLWMLERARTLASSGSVIAAVF